MTGERQGAAPAPALDLYERLIGDLDAAGARYRLIDHAPEGRTELVSALRGHDVGIADQHVVRARADKFHVILHKNVVEKDGHARRLSDVAFIVHARRPEDDVVDLPFTRRARRVHDRRILAIKRARHAIRIGAIRARVENLRFI